MNHSKFLVGLVLVALVGLILGCVRPTSDTVSPKIPVPIVMEPTITPRPANTAIPTTTPAPVSICSPLEDIELTDLKDFISNPFELALIPDSRDSGHQGTDFAYYTHPVTGHVMQGTAIQALFSGRVASVSSGKSPFGNLIMIETSVENLPQEVAALFSAYPQPTPFVAETHLTCPNVVEPDPDWRTDHPAIYVLYAHMEQPAELEVDDRVMCGSAIGLVGNSGRSGNPHLHLEIRYGPGNATIESLAHYSGDATPEEIANYCTWRVSGIFQAIDPMLVINSMQ